MTDKPTVEYLKVPLSLAQDCANYILESPCPSMAAKIPLQLVMGLRECSKVGAAAPTAPAILEKPESADEAPEAE